MIIVNTLQSNFWKVFTFMLTWRRNFIPILSIYFMTLPNSTANMIGLYTGIWNLAGFLLEIPSGYFADRFWHKKTLVLSKILMLLSTLSFIYVQNFYGFIIGSSLISASFAFTSWTMSAFMHETLESLWKEGDFSRIMWRIKWNVSLASILLIIGLPFLTKIDILIPLKVWLFLDIVGLIVSILLAKPKKHEDVEEIEIKSVLEIFKETKKLKFLPFAIFTSLIMWFLTWEAAFRTVYLESIWYPVIFLGFVMWLSRLVWFVVWRYAHLIEKYLTMKQHLFFEIFFFSLYFILVAFFSNPYLVASIFIIGIGYKWWRDQVIVGYLLKNYISDKNYKATIISIKSQIVLLFWFIIPLGIGFVMNYSYKLWYYVLGGSLFVFLLISFLFIDFRENKNWKEKFLDFMWKFSK